MLTVCVEGAHAAQSALYIDTSNHVHQVQNLQARTQQCSAAAVALTAVQCAAYSNNTCSGAGSTSSDSTVAIHRAHSKQRHTIPCCDYSAAMQLVVSRAVACPAQLVRACTAAMPHEH
jgi:hypothetical protein